MSEPIDKDLQDYLDEFNDITSFDGEICPKCGLDFTKDQVKVASWCVVKDDLQFDNLQLMGEKLEENGIHYFFTESELSQPGKKLYTLKVLNDSIEMTKKLLTI